MSVCSLAELCRQREALRVGSWVVFSPELGQHYRNGVSGGERKGNIHAEKIAVFPNVVYSFFNPQHFL